MENQVEESRNTGGRPAIAPNEVLEHRLVTRVNAQDYQDVQKDFTIWRAGRIGRMADYLREIIKHRNDPQQGVSESDKYVELTQTMYNIRQHLRHIDTNYNQITKRINSIEHAAKLYHEVKSSKAIVEQITPLLNQIDTLLKAQTETFLTK